MCNTRWCHCCASPYIAVWQAMRTPTTQRGSLETRLWEW